VVPAFGMSLLVPEDPGFFLAGEFKIVHVTDIQVDGSLDLLRVFRIVLNLGNFLKHGQYLEAQTEIRSFGSFVSYGTQIRTYLSQNVCNLLGSEGSPRRKGERGRRA
jgi:hypothetical protein